MTASLPRSEKIVNADALMERMEHLLRAHRQAMLEYSRRQIPADLRSLIDPEDVLQDSYLDCFRRLSDISHRDGEEIRRWLLTVVRNRLINLVAAHRAQKRGGGRRLQLPGEDDAVTGLLAQLAIHERTPSQSAIGHELAAKLQTQVNALRPEHKQAIRLRYFDGKSVEEAAREMNRTEAAVTMLCQRAVAELRSKLLVSLTGRI